MQLQLLLYIYTHTYITTLHFLHIFFCDSFSPGNMLWKSFQVTMYKSNLFFLTDMQYSVEWLGHKLLNHSLVHEQLHWFRVFRLLPLPFPSTALPPPPTKLCIQTFFQPKRRPLHFPCWISFCWLGLIPPVHPIFWALDSDYWQFLPALCHLSV